MHIEPYWRNFINNVWIDGDAGRIPVENPATGEQLAEMACAGQSDSPWVSKAGSFLPTRGKLQSMQPVERGRMVRAMGDYLLANHEEIAVVHHIE